MHFPPDTDKILQTHIYTRLVEQQGFLLRVKLGLANRTKEKGFWQESKIESKKQYQKDLKKNRFVDPYYQFEVIWVVALIDKRKGILPKLSLYLNHVTIHPRLVLYKII